MMGTITTGTSRRSRLLASLALGAALATGCAPQGPALPERMGRLVLDEAIEGEQAAAVVDRMHGKEVTPSRSRIGSYRGDAGTGTLYLSTYGSEEKAGEAFSAMDELIARGHPVFGHHRELEIAGRPVSFCLGEGQAHYYFRDRATVYWLAVDLAVAADALEGLLRGLPGEV